jgi:hypothetical protein
MNNAFWLGLILGLPLAIVANVLTRPVQKYLDSRIRSRALRRTRATRQEYERIKHYRQNREEFYEYMLKCIILVLFWIMGLVFLTFTAILVYVSPSIIRGRLIYLYGPPALVITTIGIILCLLSGWQYALRAIDLSYKVSNFSEYESRVKPALESEEQE